LITTLPLDEGAADVFITTPRIVASGAEPPGVKYAGVGGAYFRAMGIDLLRGRVFERLEEETGVPNVIISRSAAELFFPGEDPLGQRVRPANDADTWFTVVGVVEDVLLDDLRRAAPEPMVYLPTTALSPAIVLRSTRADDLAPEVRALIREVMPESPMYRIFTMERLAANSMASLSFTMLMLGIAATLALILAAVGLYGVLSYVVAQRTREIGIRMALGAEASALRRMIAGQGARITLLGVGIGVIAALLLTDVLETLLFGVAAVDVLTFTAMSGIMIGVALLASYIPARRASNMDPIKSLRAE
jgi:ABC-type antimicrobial peptide transport system permease subunit